MMFRRPVLEIDLARRTMPNSAELEMTAGSDRASSKSLG